MQKEFTILPYRKSAYIPEQKLNGYLLSPTHNIGKDKAKVFKKWGYGLNNSNLFAQNLLKVAINNNVLSTKTHTSGKNYEIRGKINTPLLGIVEIVTVWTLEKGKRKPHLVTAYPV